MEVKKEGEPERDLYGRLYEELHVRSHASPPPSASCVVKSAPHSRRDAAPLPGCLDVCV